MADLTVFIDGVDRSNLIDRQGGGVSYDRDINGQGNARLVLADVPSGFIPDDGMEVLIKEDGADQYGGIINGRPRGFHGPDHADQLTFYSIDVASWELRLNKRRVWRSYGKKSFTFILEDLTTDFLSGEGITTSIVAGSSSLDINFNGDTVAEAVDRLCALEVDGRSWHITPAKVLTVVLPTTTAAPVTLTTTNVSLDDPGPTIEPDRTGYANRITVVGGNPELPILYTAEDTGEQAARAAIEGGSGIYHDTIEDNEITAANQAQIRAEGILGQRKQLRQKFIGMTNEPGFAVAQDVTINLPNLGIVSKQFFIVEISTTFSPNTRELWHTITAIDGPVDGSWQSGYRRKVRARTIPMQIEATPGLVRVEPEPGVLIHDPEPEPSEWFQGVKSGTLTGAAGIGALGITNQGRGLGGFVVQVGRGPVAVPRQSHLELFAIDADDKPATTFSLRTWDELHGSSFKATAIVSPDNTKAVVIERNAGNDPVLLVLSLATGKLGSVVVTGMVDNNNATEGAWVGNYVYWPETTTGSIFVFDVSDPANPTLDNEFDTGLAIVDSCVPNKAGTFLYAVGIGADVVAIDISNPTAPSVTDTEVVTGSYPSLDIDPADGRLVMFHRSSGALVRYAVIDVDGGTLTLNTEDTLALATTTMAGVAVMFFDDSAIVFSIRPPAAPVDSAEAHVFKILGGVVTFTETLSITHAGSGNVGPSRSYLGNRAVIHHAFNTDLQLTFGAVVFDKIVPYTIEKPLREQFGGTGIDGAFYIKGDLLAAAGESDLDPLPIAAGEGGFLRTRSAETLGLRWDRDLLLNQVAIDDTDSPYDLPLGITVVLADASAGAITVNLPTVLDHLERWIVVKNDGSGANAVTIAPAGAETIDDEASRVLSGTDDVVGMVASGSEWEVVQERLSSPVIDHGALTGLADDDHAQYFLLAGRLAVATPTRSVDGFVTLDSFGRSDGNPGAPWVEHQAGWIIASNRLINAAAGFERITNTDVSRGPMLVQGILRVSATAPTPRLTARYDYNAGNDDGYEATLVTSATTRIQLGRRTAGAFTLLGETNVSLSVDTDYVVQLYVADGVQQLTANGVTVAGTDTDHDGANARSAGFNHFNGATGTYDDFLVCKGRDVVVSGLLAPGLKAKILNAGSGVVATATAADGVATIDASVFGGATEAVPLVGWPTLIITDRDDVELARYTATPIYPGDAYAVVVSADKSAQPPLVVVLAAAASTMAIGSDVVVVVGDAGANTLTTITGGLIGQTLILLFVDALVTISDNDAHDADSVDLAAAFTSADDATLTLMFDGVSWYEVSRSRGDLPLGADIIVRDGSVPFTGAIDAGGQLVDNAPFLRGYIDGFLTSNAADADHDILIGPGVCADVLDQNDRILELVAAITKRIDAGWSEGDAQGGMATGAVAADTEYNLIVIEQDSTPGNIDVVFDVSATGANAPSGWTAVRRIGSVFTDGSSNIREYTQLGDTFFYTLGPLDINDTTLVDDTFETGTLSVPANTLATFNVIARGNDATFDVRGRLRPAVGSSGGYGVPRVRISSSGGGDDLMAGANMWLVVDGNSQFEYTVNALGTGDPLQFLVQTMGWIDGRGRDA